ncbi:[LysW]-lysine hydrolase [Halococcus saccharolyticus]|uniref:Putative [LysW]-lysine/[LysW]-ornithine hydrolase n=1 Tax=Halococcus saccharolyticus DSM 5350 TaxID=1227455 RepID=M0MAE5_9EURY|nr:[LysW]-lysine hydrolase [Halococcus saccharolyticus]EMA42721.1 acetyl-lysine deacetylase [Halococcus saccharolyticus DSM 5350]
MSEALTGVSVSAARDLLVELVETPSPTGEEAACAEILVDFFENHGREAFLDEVGNVRAPADDAVLLTSHIDTVPGDIPVRIEPGDGEREGSEVLWGRGSVDATGPLVAMAVAAVRTGVSFVGVVGEEVDSSGARHLVETRDAPDAVVNGEPSGWNGITLGYRGLLAGTYVATSESGHTSRPENSAIEDAIDWWERVRNTVADDRDEWTPVFERVTPKPIEVHGGTSDDGLSVEATMDVQFRVPPSLTVEEVREAADGELNGGTVRWYDEVSPVMTSPRNPVARTFRGAIRRADGEPRLLRKTGTSDMNIYQAWDCPMVTYGPGDSDLDHAPDERLSLDEFDRSTKVLEDVAEQLGGDA